jgi:hypothetical protein
VGSVMLVAQIYFGALKIRIIALFNAEAKE